MNICMLLFKHLSTRLAPYERQRQQCFFKKKKTCLDFTQIKHPNKKPLKKKTKI